MMRSLFRCGILLILSTIIFTYSIFSQSFRSVNFQGAGWVTAVKYTSNGARLYARTDVGGVFKSDNGGESWQFISGYAATISGLYIQGLAVHPANNNIIYIACGTSYRPTDEGRGVWKTIDGGNSWTHVLQNVNFSGNDDIRWGGECIVIDQGNPEIVYTGGRESGILKTTNGGNTWSIVAASNIVTGNISSITIKPGTSGNTAEIWTGSEGNAGVWRSTNGGGSWSQLRNSGEVEGKVFRIAVKSDGTAFVAYNESLARYNGTWANIPGFSGAGSLAAVFFMGTENKVIASRMNFTRLSMDGGQTFPQVLPMTMQGPLPKHSFNWTVVDWARNHFQQNPVNANEWYMSGGFGCLKSTDAGLNWRYKTDGINIPVMYRTHFHITNPNYIFLPMGDLTMGRITDGGASGELTDYAFYSFAVLQDFSNSTAVLTTAANANKNYIVGGNIYSGEISGVFVTNNNGANYTKVITNGLPLSANRPIINGVASDVNENQLIVFVGGDYSNAGTVGGIYWSSNGGQNFTKSNGIPANIMAPGVFYSNYGLAKDPISSAKRYGYFEGDGGGFYESNDEGRNWSLKSGIFSGYKPAGTLCVHPVIPNLFYLAVSYTGLFTTTNGGSTWANMSGWVNAWQVDARGNIITVFGKRTGDTYDKIYKSTNSGSSWELITTGIFKLPNITSLVINPHNTNQLWIGTTGNGTFIYDGLTIGISIISSEIPFDYELEQNYPNPFNPSTRFKFKIPVKSNIKIILYDIGGKTVKNLFEKVLNPGIYSYNLISGELSSGIYFCRLITDSRSFTRKIVLLK